MTVGWLKLGFALLLMVAPAAWPLLTLRRSGLSARGRVALALALSPVVVGGLVLVFRALGGARIRRCGACSRSAYRSGPSRCERGTSRRSGRGSRGQRLSP